MRERREAEIHRLIGGELCLDFANTLNGHTRPSPHEYLHDYRDLILWAQHAGVLSPSDFRELSKQAETRPSKAEEVFRNALVTREVIFRIFSALAIRDKPVKADVERLNQAWQESQCRSQLILTSAGFTLGWDDEPSLECVSRLVVASAVHLLASKRVEQIRRCAGEGCDWLFLDVSRNHLRRWCSMDECGNRAKMRRRQHRKNLMRSK